MRKTIRHLLPKSDQWALDKDRPLARLFHGIADFLDGARSKVDEVVLEFFPQFATDPHTQLEKLGIARQYTEPLSIERARLLLFLMRETPTDMSPGRFQRILNTLWPSLRVYQWWGSEDPYVARNPADHIIQPLTGRTRCGATASRCGVPSARCDRFLTNQPNYLVNGTAIDNPPPPYIGNPEGVLYIGSDIFGISARIDETEQGLLEVLLLKFKRATNWIVLFVSYAEPVFIATEDSQDIHTEGDIPMTTEL